MRVIKEFLINLKEEEISSFLIKKELVHLNTIAVQRYKRYIFFQNLGGKRKTGGRSG